MQHSLGKPLHVLIEGGGRARLADMFRSWRQEVKDYTGTTGGAVWARFANKHLTTIASTRRCLERALQRVTKRLGFKEGFMWHSCR